MGHARGHEPALLTMKTKPRGIHATFAIDCPHCEGELTVTNGRPDPHQCERPVSLADIRAALEAK